MDCPPDGKSVRRLNAIHLLLIGVSYEHVLRNARRGERTLRLWVERFNEQPGEQGKTVHLVLDNASWHKSTSLDWHHLKPVYLPPYSPDFNPIERLWQHLKGQYLAGFITAKGGELEDKILASLQALLNKPETIRSVCSIPRLNRQ